MTTQSNEQTEAFPRSTMEILEQLRGVHAEQLEKAILALDALSDDEKIAKRYDKAEEKVAGCRELLRNIDRALEELRAQVAPDTVLAAAIDRLGAENVSVSFAATVDTDTGEVTEYQGEPVTANEWDERTCQDCNGEGRLPDRTGGGHHKCRACGGNGSVMVKGDPSPVVVVLYPGTDDPVVTVIGDRTRYSELVADYLATLGPIEEMNSSIDDWQVLAEDELTHNGGGGRNLTAVIQERDYGHRLLVAAAVQGSVTGAESAA
jgi:hypothetical protein